MRGLLVGLIAALILTGCAKGEREPAITTVPVADWTVPPSAEFVPLPGPTAKVDVTFEIQERHNYSARDSARRDTLAILRQARQDYQGHPVLVNGTEMRKDDYGNTARRSVLNAFYDWATISRINFVDIDPSTIWDIRDGGIGYMG